MINIDRQHWDEFLLKHPNAHLLQTTYWGELKSSFGWDVSRLITRNTGVQILFKKLVFGITWAYIPKGPVGDSWNDMWPLVDSECRRKKAVFLKIEPDYWEADREMVSTWLSSPRFIPSDHHIQPARTLLVNLEGTESQVLSRMKQKTRYNIGLAARKGVKIHPSNNIDRFYDLMLITGERDTFGIHSLDYYRDAFNQFNTDGKCELLFAEYQGKLLAALMVFASGLRAWYFFGASSSENRNLMAPYALQWEAMGWARAKGCTSYDLWGVPDYPYERLEGEFTHRNDGLWGVYRFKRGFGGNLRRVVGTWDWVYNPLLYAIYHLWVNRTQL
jgi:peptidoglycan pentaglycine glycine transferase (the first glycine)